VPKTQKDVKYFAIHFGYYKLFIENLKIFTSPLFKLLNKVNAFFWNILCQNTFENLKENFSIDLVLREPNRSLPFHISMDSLDTTLREVL
jgi:hypothetical protein